MSSTPVQRLLHDVWLDVHQPAALLQLAVVALALVLAYGVARWMRPRLNQTENWQLGMHGFARVMFPLAAVACVWLMVQGFALAGWATGMLRMSMTLLAALAVVRLGVYGLQQMLSAGHLLRRLERGLAWGVWCLWALYLSGVAPEVVQALQAITLTSGKQPLTLWLLLNALLSMALTLAVTLWLSRLAERRVLRAEQLDLSLRVVLSKLIRATALFLGVLIALAVVGIDITVFSVFSGAVGVGLGLGLQKIASNYVSGFIILLDRSLRPGDLVTVEGRQGRVTRLTTRYVIVRQADGAEVLIPNDTLITTTVLNHTHTDHLQKVTFGLRVALETDIDLACRLCVQALQEQQRFLAEPPVEVQVRQIGGDGVELELAAWVGDPENGLLNLRSDVWKRLLSVLRQHQILLAAASPAASPGKATS